MYAKKVFTVTFPTEGQVPREFMSHFIRGYIDGDGSISLWGNTAQSHIMGSTFFITGLKEYLEKLGFKCSKVGSYPPYKPETSEIHICGRKNLALLREFLYKDATIFLERKKNIFDRI